jgi:hypothetical protein
LTGQLFEAKVWDDGPASSLFFIDATSANCLSVPHSDAVEDSALEIQLQPRSKSEVHERADAKKCLGSLIVTLIVIPRFVVKVLEAELAK